MKRDLKQLADTAYDLLVVGGGITGAFLAWDAALRGLTVALVDKGDFGHATSAASSKIIHSGIRYLQQLGFGRFRESLQEQKIFLRMAPHLVHPVPFLIPTYGHGLRGKGLLVLAMACYRLLETNQEKPGDPGKRLPPHRFLGRREVLALEPDLPSQGLTGGLVYHECQMHSSERMTLGVIRSAVQAGARAANYVEVTDFLRRRDEIVGVRARDVLSGDTLEIQARMVVNASGPWVRHLLARLWGEAQTARMSFAKGVHLLTRPLTRGHALALLIPQRSEALVGRGGRHLFIIPWRGHALIGTTNVPFPGEPDAVRVTEGDVRDFVREINAAYPAAALRGEDVRFAYAGLYPLEGRRLKPGVYQGGGRYRIHDHERAEGIRGLISVVAVKYTTARSLAQKAVDLVFRKWGRTPPPCLTARTPIHGGDIPCFHEFLSAATRKPAYGLSPEAAQELVLNHGTAYEDVLRHVAEDPRWARRLSEARPTIAAEVLHGVREEMAQTLSDVVFRRTGLGTLGHPGEACLQACAEIMAGELGWRAERTQRELAAVRRALRPAGEA